VSEARNLRRQRRRTREKARGIRGKFWIAMAAAVFYPVTFLLARTRFIGMERIPAEGPALLVLNHVSHVDPVYDAVMVHRAGRLPRFLAKNTLWNVPVFPWVLDAAEQIPVYRGTADAQKALQEAHRALGENKVVLIYPDGTITKDPQGWPMVPKVGVARLALQHDVPVIPIGRWGTREVFDGYHKKLSLFPRKTVTVHVGEPIDLAAHRADLQDNQALRKTAELIMGRVRTLVGEVRGERPPEEFFSSARKPEPDEGVDA
jgi:1-acyl-sn-glycerol-3-phosphate acyltransferase